MNGPRSHNSSMFSKDATLETLSRTIEDLETKILGAPNARPHVNQASEQPMGGFQKNDLTNEIRSRQRTLSGNHGRAMAHPSRYASDHMSYTSTQSAAGAAQSGSQFAAELSQLLSQLRQELKQDMQASVNKEIGKLQRELIDLRDTTRSDSSVPASLGADLEQIAASLKQLESGHSQGVETHEIDSLRLEVDSLRSLVDQLAREETLIGLDHRWGSIEQSLKGFSPDLVRGEFANLADRLNEMRSALANMHQNNANLAPLEEKLDIISSALSELMGRPSDVSHQNHFAEFTNQTEQRLNHLASQLEMLNSRSESGVADRIEAISARVGSLFDEKVFQNLEDRMANLQASLENNVSVAHVPELNDRLAELSSKVEAFDERASNVETAGIERLVTQLTEIAGHLDDRMKPVEIAGLDKLEQQLHQLNARLEEGTPSPSANVDSLQGQIEQLSELVRNTSVGEVSEKLDNLHEHLNTNDEFVLEAAKQAAQATLEAYGSGSSAANSAVQGSDNEVINSLAVELKKLEEVQKSSEARSAKAFDTVHQSLSKIFEGLERLHDRDVNGQASNSASVPRSQEELKVEPAPSLAPESFDNNAAGSHPEQLPPEEPFVDLETALAGENIAEDKAPAKGANSLLAGLANRMKTAISDKGSEAETPAPVQQRKEPTNALDELESEFADEPLEPGSGAPDINSIMEKVRDVQKARADDRGDQTPGNPQDFLSSARQAALAATAETEAVKAEPKKRRLKFKEKSEGAPLVRKPVLIAAGAILLAVLAFPLVKQVLNFGDSPSNETAQVTIEDTPDKLSTDGVAIVDQPAQNVTIELADQQNSGPRIVDLPNPNDANVNSAEGGQIGLDPLVAEQPNAIALSNDQTASISNDEDLSAFTIANDLPASVATDAMRQAALTGDPVALYEIGARFADGRGTDVSYDEAIKWLELSSDQDFAPAQYRLGNLYEKGTGVSRDLDKARELYSQAAEAGNVSAMHNLGVLHASSGGIGEMAKAAEWFTKAANYGVRDSQVNIAILYARGEGVARDLVESYKWFAIAATQGDQDAASKRDQVLDALSEDNLQIAQQKVASWQAEVVDNSANNVQIPDAWIEASSGTASIDMNKAIKNIQAILNNNGFDAGRPDGIIGKKTINAIKEFQASIGMEPNGEISDQLVQELLKRNG